MTGVEKKKKNPPKYEAQLSLQSLTIKVNNLPPLLLLLLLLRQNQCTCCDFGWRPFIADNSQRFVLLQAI